MTTLAVTGIGLMSPIGHSAETCMHSVRSAVTRLSLQPYPDRAKAWIAGGKLLCWTPYMGHRHWEQVCGQALNQAWQQAHSRSGAPPSGTIALILGHPEGGRPGRAFPGEGFDLSAWFTGQTSLTPNHVEVIPAGACSGQAGLYRAQRLFESGAADVCVIGAADTQLQLRTIRWHEQNDRLKCSYATDGLMPAEGAGFLVVEPEERAHRRGANVISQVLSIGVGREAGTILSDEPNTATGLTTAIRQALQNAGLSAGDIGKVWSDLNGESYRAREWAFAEIRLEFGNSSDLLHPADCHGDLGVATDTNLLAMAAMCHATGWSTGKPILIFSGSEKGIRAATVLGATAERGFMQVSTQGPHVISDAYKIPAPLPEEDFRDFPDPWRAYFDWQLDEEHCGELAALYYQRRAILRDGTVPWHRAREPEQRILNHLDAISAEGGRALAKVAACVTSAEEGLCFAAALVIGCYPQADNLAMIELAFQEPTPERLAGIEVGLVNAPAHDELTDWIGSWLGHPDPGIREMMVRIASIRRIDVREDLTRFLEDSSPGVVAAAAGSIWRLAVGESSASLVRVLDHEHSGARRAALEALVCLRPTATAAYCRARLRQPGLFGDTLPRCLAICGVLEDAVAIGQVISDRPEDTSLIEALGILGSIDSVPLLLDLLGSSRDEVKAAAAAALQLISGVRSHKNTENADSQESAEMERPADSGEAWTRWWSANRRAAGRMRHGQPFTLDLCVEELRNGASAASDRRRAYQELVVLGRTVIPFEPDWFIAPQEAAIQAWRGWCETRSRGRSV